MNSPGRDNPGEDARASRTVSPVGPPGDEISIAEVVLFFRGQWQLMVVCAFAGMLVLAVAAFMMTPVYRASVVLSPVEQDVGGGMLGRIAGQLGPLGSLVGDLGIGGSASGKEVSLATLRSRALLEEFVRKNDLMQVLFADRWDEQAGSWRVRFGRSIEPTMQDAVQVLREDVIAVSEDRRTGLVTLSSEWTDPQLAADWANELVSMTNEIGRQRVIDENARNIEYLESELAKTDVVDRRQIIYRLIESRTSEIMLANGRPEYSFAVIDRAMAPDPDRYVRPDLMLMLMAGSVGGLLFGVIVALVRVGLAQARLAEPGGAFDSSMRRG